MALPDSVPELVALADAGDRRALGRLLSIVESDRRGAAEVRSTTFAKAGEAWITGITGAPGAGKSTLTDRLLTRIRRDGTRVAVVAVDPSSPYTGGAVLGDRVRMQDHIDDPGVFIRSLASRGSLGGVSHATPQCVTVLDGMGFPEIIIETVGVGQAEVDIVEHADTTIVVLNPGWGDGIQAAKAGLLEIGDIFVVNKADRPGTDEAIKDIKQMLQLGEHGMWIPPVIATKALVGDGVEELWSAVLGHRSHLEASGELGVVRRRRLETELRGAIEHEVRKRGQAALAGGVVEEVLERRLDPWAAAAKVFAGAPPAGSL